MTTTLDRGDSTCALKPGSWRCGGLMMRYVLGYLVLCSSLGACSGGAAEVPVVPALADVARDDASKVHPGGLDVTASDANQLDTAATLDGVQPDAAGEDTASKDVIDENPGDGVQGDVSGGIAGCAASPTFGYAPGKSVFGHKAWIQFIPGELPIIFSAPHGGYLKPAEIKDRVTGLKNADSYTLETTLLVAAALFRATGKWPHVVLNRLHRSKLDANREIVEAAQGDELAEQAWGEFHKFIDVAKAEVAARCGRGLYIDMHANAHASKWTEFGYRLTTAQLNKDDSALNTAALIALSSMRALVSQQPTKLPLGWTKPSHAKVLRSATSLGGRLQAVGFKSVPSPAHPGPGTAAYFRGGYNTARHGSQKGGSIDGVQIETYTKFIATSAAGRLAYSDNLAKVIHGFVTDTYGWPLGEKISAPSHATCAQAMPLTWSPSSSGKLSVSDNTVAATNEFGKQVTCGGALAVDGPQLYYTLTLKAGVTYRFRLMTSFPTRLYLFEDTCTPAAISASCKANGLAAPLIKTGEDKSFTIKIKKGGLWRIAVDSVSDAWLGHFQLNIDVP